jgi:hypothetical protein
LIHCMTHPQVAPVQLCPQSGSESAHIAIPRCQLHPKSTSISHCLQLHPRSVSVLCCAGPGSTML